MKMSPAFDGDVTEAAQACLYSVVDRFNTEDPFWSAFVPEFDSTSVGEGRFSVVLSGLGARIMVRGTIVSDAADPSSIMPVLSAGGIPVDDVGLPQRWHPISCSVDDKGRFSTSNFRVAIEASLRDLKG